MTLTARITQILSTRPDNVNKQVEEIERFIILEVGKALLYAEIVSAHSKEIKTDDYLTNLKTENK